MLIEKSTTLILEKQEEDPMFKKNPAKEQAWKEKLQRFERSGLSGTKWCEHHEKIHTFKYWKLRLKPSPLPSGCEEIPHLDPLQ